MSGGKETMYKGKPRHILAEPGSIAPRVIVVGDPGRASRLAELLTNTELVNENRGLLVYTGTYKGYKITIATHGIGGPSASLVIEELHDLGAETMVRLGTCGGLRKEMEAGSVVVPWGAATLSKSSLSMYVNDFCPAPVPTPKVQLLIADSLRKRGINTYEGVVFTSDSFYAETKYLSSIKELGVIAVEMECATLFTISRIKGFKSGAALIISNNLETGEGISKERLWRVEKEVFEAIAMSLAKL